MRELICDTCRQEFALDEIELKNRVIAQDENGDDVIEQYFTCPLCGEDYSVIILDRQQEELIKKRRQIRARVNRAIQNKRADRARKYAEQEQELKNDIRCREEMLKESMEEDDDRRRQTEGKKRTDILHQQRQGADRKRDQEDASRSHCVKGLSEQAQR